MEELKRERQAAMLEKAAKCADMPRMLARRLEEMAYRQLEPDRCAVAYRANYIGTGAFGRHWGICTAGPVQWKRSCGEEPHSSKVESEIAKHMGLTHRVFARHIDDNYGDHTEYYIEIKPEAFFK